MAWPKRHTRAVHLDEEVFVWHLKENRLDTKERSILIGKENARYVLYLDPYVWDIVPTPSTIREVITWAKAQGWKPENGPSRALSYSREQQRYVWLPEGIRHIYQLNTID